MALTTFPAPTTNCTETNVAYEFVPPRLVRGLVHNSALEPEGIFKAGSLGVVVPLTIDVYVLGTIALVDAPNDMEATQFVDVEVAQTGSIAVTIPPSGRLGAHGPDALKVEHSTAVVPLPAVMSEIAFHW